MKNIKINEEWLNEDGTYTCPYCSKKFTKKGISTHIWRSHDLGKNHNPNLGYEKDRVIWNKGKTAETDECVKKIKDTLNAKFQSGQLTGSFLGKTHKPESIKKISKALSINNKGGRAKWYDIENTKGELVKVQGTWEFRFAKILNLIDSNWIKPSLNHPLHSFRWIDSEGNSHTYTPDFWSPKLGKYFEIKGYWWGDDKLKMTCVLEQHNHVKIEIIHKKELEAYELLLK